MRAFGPCLPWVTMEIATPLDEATIDKLVELRVKDKIDQVWQLDPINGCYIVWTLRAAWPMVAGEAQVPYVVDSIEFEDGDAEWNLFPRYVVTGIPFQVEGVDKETFDRETHKDLVITAEVPAPAWREIRMKPRQMYKDEVAAAEKKARRDIVIALKEEAAEEAGEGADGQPDEE